MVADVRQKGVNNTSTELEIRNLFRDRTFQRCTRLEPSVHLSARGVWAELLFVLGLRVSSHLNQCIQLGSLKCTQVHSVSHPLWMCLGEEGQWLMQHELPQSPRLQSPANPQHKPPLPPQCCPPDHSHWRERPLRALGSLFACRAHEHQEVVDVQLDLVATSS